MTTDVLKPINGEIELDEMSFSRDNIEINVELDPQSALPLHLQKVVYDQDIWNRLKGHPMRNPTLFQKKLDEDTESREIIRQVMAAAHQRESEILMHNQSRVFRHILGRVVSDIGKFLNEPLLPWFSVEATSEKNNAQPQIIETKEQSSKKQRVFKLIKSLNISTKQVLHDFLVWIMTPKYIGFLILAFLGLATGWSQFEIYHLKRSIAAYEQSTKATDTLQDQMNSLVENSEKQLNDLIQEKKQALSEASDLRTQLSAKTQEVASLDAQLKIQGKTIERLTDLKGDISKAKDEEKILREQQQKDLIKSQKELADIKAQNQIVDANLTRATSLLEETNVKLENANRKSRAYINQLAEQNNRINELLSKANILRNAETCISSIKREVNKQWGHNLERVNRYINEYEIRRDENIDLSSR